MGDTTQRKIYRQYEPEVDGLRALAVLVVIFFHAGLKGFKGGFVGVDIFFVISGYLITRNILSDISLGTFTYKEFYIHRARRIFPAMFVTMVLSAIAGLFIFSPLDLERFAASLVYACGAVQNIFFWTEAGYWDASKDVKPILHFWSLGVEEQFYFFWPLLLLSLHAVLRPGKNNERIFLVIVLMSLVSLFAAQFFVTRDATAVFYLTPFRVFEFGIGALVIWAVPFFDRMTNTIKEVCVLCATAAIVYAVRRFSENMPFPGMEALVPCMGAAIIIGARTARYSGAAFRNRLVVGVGLISYSLYLVHWPVFVFYKYYHLKDLTGAETSGLIALSFLIAYCMYRFVEQPFRKARPEQAFFLKPAHFFMLMVFLLVGLATSAAYAWNNPGWSSGSSRDLAIVSENTRTARLERHNYLLGCVMASYGPCNRKGAAHHYLLLGDSFGEDVGIGLYNAYPDYEISLNTDGGCKALLNSPTGKNVLANNDDRCIRYYDKVFVGSNNWSRYDALLLSMAWTEENIPFLEQTIAFFKAHGAKRIIVVGPKVKLRVLPSQILALSKTLDDFKRISQQEMDFALEEKLKAAMEATATKTGVEFLDISKAECPEKDCPNLVPGTLMPIIWDEGHWTLDGSRYIGKNTKSYFQL